jgi:leucyl aminopeptidase
VLRRAAATVVRQSRGARKAVTTLTQALPGDPAAAVQAVAEGALLAAYRFDKYKHAKANGARPAELATLALVPGPAAGRGSGGRSALTGALAAGQVRAAATNLARDLSNEPANALHPADLAAAARRLLAGKGVTVKVKNEKELAAEGFGGIIGVGQGADHPPRLIELRYAPKGAAGDVVLVGKGITFDSGGLDLKTAEGMERMKGDMSGAAAVLGVLKVLPRLRPAVEVHGLVAATDNMPSGSATKPGDVLRAMNGKTIEVNNTDAEGRLTLADAIAYARKEIKPHEIVDIATLTGACSIALGSLCGGAMSNDAALQSRVLAAGARVGERLWPLPLIDEYREGLRSEVADLRNTGPRPGGAITAGLFIREFAGDTPWVHLDIAGVAFTDKDLPYASKGGVGFGARTLIEYVLTAAGRG